MVWMKSPTDLIRREREREKAFDKLIKDIEDIYVVCKETVEILRYIHPFSFSEELNEALDILKMKLDKFLRRRDEYLEMMDKFRGNDLKLAFKPKETNSLIWKGVEIFGEVIKDLIETENLELTLKEAISDYCQGVSDIEIKRKLKDKRLKLEVFSSSMKIASEGIEKVSLFKTIRLFSKSPDNNSLNKLLEEALNGEYEIQKIKEIYGLENEKMINRHISVVKNQIDWSSEEVKRNKKKLLVALKKLGCLEKNERSNNNVKEIIKNLESGKGLEIRKDYKTINLDINDYFEEQEKLIQETQIQIPPK